MKQLQTFILANSNRNNHYVFDRRKKSTLLCNPVLHYLLKLFLQGTDTRQWIDSMDTGDFPVEIEDCEPVSKEELEYYHRKFLFLKDSGYFSEPKEEKFHSGHVKPEFIEFSLANCRQITFEVTERCNMNCKYCGYGHFYKVYGNRKENDLSISKAQRFLNFMTRYWNSTLNTSYGKTVYISFYGGEPLLDFNFIKEIARFVKTINLFYNQVQFSMTTNALLLEKHMDFLVENRFNLLISLDGDEKNNGYRVYKNGEPAFKDILKNINALKDHYPDYFREKVNFNAVLHDKNSVSEIHSYFKEVFDKTPRIGELKNIGVKTAKQRDFMNIYTAINESLYNENTDSSAIRREMFIKLPEIQNLSNFLSQYSGFIFEDYKQLSSYTSYKKHTPTGACMPFSKKIFVAVTGKLLPCESIIRRFTLGKVTDKKVDMDFNRIARQYNAYFEKISHRCNLCYNKEACVACIFNLMGQDDNPFCNYWMDYTCFSKYLSRTLDYFEKEPFYYPLIMEGVSID